MKMGHTGEKVNEEATRLYDGIMVWTLRSVAITIMPRP